MPVLSAIIVVALKGVFRKWRRGLTLWAEARAQHASARAADPIPHRCSLACAKIYRHVLTYAVTFCSVIFLSVELGALLGILVSVAFFAADFLRAKREKFLVYLKGK
jgi:hypothetical protein